MAHKSIAVKPLSTIRSKERSVETYMALTVAVSKTLSRNDPFAITASVQGSSEEVLVATINMVTVTIVPTGPGGKEDYVLVNLNVTSPDYRTDSPITLSLRFLDSEGNKILDKRLLFNVLKSHSAVNYAGKTDVKSGSLDAASSFLRNVLGGMWVVA
jgi:hypothetical protein